MGYPMEKKFWKDTNEDCALYTTRKLINTNGNTEGIFSLVHC
jgi:hypothetical protein